ncbi:bifunctional DedA family/phosphatase PAP2 family protein [Rhizobium sp. 2MFCol3.1]|uniref:bifunctional DedA family/phosphatase PAP2 family protein n=1 Tax=Rhizobium sp. 2MFCol3.1 TaxID=1246459 RepID=UPI00036A603C|nr:bifunctional DedA family/phosphatase PAP2 family protein [Rhizobium sp. 2MFCol3.1]
MASFVASFVQFLSAQPHLAYGAVFLLALSESVPVIGAVIPGTAIIVALSALVPSGVLALWPLLAAAIAGAIAGDGIAFWLGHRYHRHILSLWPISRYPAVIARSEAFFERHGDKSVFIARFAPGIRAFVPLLAGMLAMPVRRFYLVNILSAVVWAPSHILPGVLVGASFGALGSSAKPVAIVAVLLIVLGWLLLTGTRFFVRFAAPRLAARIERLRMWADSDNSRMARLLSRFLDPDRPQLRIRALVAALLVGALWLFAGILEDVATQDPIVVMDQAIFQAFQELRTPIGDAIMIAVTELGDTRVVVAVTAVVFAWLAWSRAWRAAAFWLLAVAGGSALNTAIKVALHRARPNELLYSGWSAFSFPSGHSTVNMVLYGFLAFLIARGLQPAWRVTVVAAAALLVFVIAFSRVYLGAHWLSDVVGGVLFGFAWLALVGLFFLGRPGDKIRPAPLLLAALLAVAVAGGGNIYANHSVDIGRYARQI